MPASEADVLFEQLEFLLAHAAECARPQCSDCSRLKRVRTVLLEPFGEPPRKPQPAQAVPGAVERYAESVKRWHEAARAAQEDLRPARC